MTFRALGDRALRIELGDGLDSAVSEQVHTLMRNLDAARAPGVLDMIPGYGTLTLVYDPLTTEPDRLERAVQACLDQETTGPSAGRTWEIPVVYGGSRGPDLAVVASLHGVSPEAVVSIHTSVVYRVYAIGFMPGFPYLGVLPAELATPRLDAPRPVVTKGSVAIAGRQTGIYPAASPGGWRILGWTPVELFDTGKSPPSLLDAGDMVRFVPVGEKEAVAWRPSRPWR